MIQDVLVARRIQSYYTDSPLLYKDDNDRRLRFMKTREDATREEMHATAKALMSFMEIGEEKYGLYLREKHLLEEDTSQVKS